ncbi:GCIP-interacting family protein [Wolffia australiana]
MSESSIRAHPDCINASNPYHECVEYCFHKIAEDRKRAAALRPPSPDVDSSERVLSPERASSPDAHPDDNDSQKEMDAAYPNMSERQKKLFELRLKMNEAQKANQMAMVAEKKKLEAPPESRGVSKQKWLEDRKKRIGKLLDANGLEMKKAYMLDTQEMAEAKYKKWEKDPAPAGWDVFNQKTLYNAHKKRTKNMEIDMEAYNKAKEEDPEFYRNAASLQYGKDPKIPEENVDRMVRELRDREAKRKSFSRRRKFHEEKDIDSINDRNEHFNKKIERAFGKYTLEIKNNLERGTALPD